MATKKPKGYSFLSSAKLYKVRLILNIISYRAKYIILMIFSCVYR